MVAIIFLKPALFCRDKNCTALYGASKCWLLGNIMGHLPVYHQLAVKLMAILELEGGEEISC